MRNNKKLLDDEFCRGALLLLFMSKVLLPTFLRKKSRLRHLIGKLAAAEDVEMEMGNGLARIRTAVGDNAVAVRNARALCDCGNLFKDIRNDGGVFTVYFVNASNVRFGNNENVNGSLGRDIVESKNLIVFIRFFGGDIAVYDLAEKAVFYHIIYTPLNSFLPRGAWEEFFYYRKLR